MPEKKDGDDCQICCQICYLAHTQLRLFSVCGQPRKHPNNYIRSRSKYRPVVALISTHFAGQDPLGTGPGPPRPPVQFVKRALFLGWEMARAEGFILKLATCIGDSLVLVHDETHFAEAESAGVCTQR